MTHEPPIPSVSADARLDAFLDAARDTFHAMLGLPVTVVRTGTGRGPTLGYDVSGIIGLTRLGGAGSAHHGALVLSFSEDVARRTVGRILGTEQFAALDQDVADGIGELVNIIAGQAKRGLARAGIEECRTTLPNVILGSQHRVFHQRDVERLEAEFESGIGVFLLQLLLVPAERTAMAGTEQGA